jgi:hypothetical protein
VVLKRLFGYLLIFTAAAGFILSVVVLFEIWHYRPVVTQTVNDTLVLLDQALTTTARESRSLSTNVQGSYLAEMKTVNCKCDR